MSCSAVQSHSIAYPHPRSPIFNDLTVAVCRNCGLGTVEQSINPAELQRYYQQDYAGLAGRDEKPEPESYFSDTGMMFKPQRSLSQLRLARKRVKQAPRVILDLGAGFGTTLYLARRDFWPEATLIAVEPDLSMERYLEMAGANQVSSLAEVENGSCDLIIASHVLEHYQGEELAGVLAELRSVLAPGGTLLAEVPNSDFSSDIGIAGHSHEPHLLFFSKRAFGNIFGKSGFRVSFLSTVGPSRSRSFTQKLSDRLRRLIGRPAAEYGGNRAALRLLAHAA